MKALFLDRDGIINVDLGYVHKIEDFHFINGIFHLCKMFIDNGFSIIVATNQSGIERGYFTKKQFMSLTDWMKQQFKMKDIHILDVFYCPFLSGPNRKPNPGMFLDAIAKYNIDVSQSVSIGDSQRDIDAAKQANIKHNFLVDPDISLLNAYDNLENECKKIGILI